MNAASNLKDIKARIGKAMVAAGRLSESVTLVAVSKTFDIDAIRPVLKAGQRIFGENRVQEAKAKWPLLRQEFSGIELHLIGPLQSNKTGEAVALFDVIETIDREKIAAAISTEMRRQGKRPRLLVQVNIGNEPQKAGIDPKETGVFLALCRERYDLEIEGLMCIPPADEKPTKYFFGLVDLARDHGLSKISMGMSGDFEEAIACGATDVRVGSAIFGHR